MDIVLDSVTLNHLLRFRRPRHRRSANRASDTVLDPHLRSRRLALAIDIDGGLTDEWGRTCGPELVRVLLARWEGMSAFAPVEPANAIPLPISKRLRQEGLRGTIDKLVIRIALSSQDHTVVSDDGHFWCPGNSAMKGDPNAPISRICFIDLGIEVILLATLLGRLTHRTR